MIYVYGIADKGCVLPAGMAGLNDTPVALLTHGDIAAIVSTTEVQRVPLVESNMWQHEKLIELLMTGCAVLPARYGTVLRDEREMRDILALNHNQFAANLERVRGQVELSLRVLWDDADAASIGAAVPQESAAAAGHSGGRAYMLARLQEDRQQRARRQRGQAQVDLIQAALTDLASQFTHKTFVTPRLLLTAAYLVERGCMGPFQNAVARMAAAHTGLQFLCTGPWPPYSFVDVKVNASDRSNEDKVL